MSNYCPPQLWQKGGKWRLGIKGLMRDESRVDGVWKGPSPCARGMAREGETWLTGLGEVPAPAAPGVVEEAAVVETGPLATTIHRGNHTVRMDQWE